MRILISLLCLLFTLHLAATPTEINVRVLAKDAKFIGTSMEGALVTITDVDANKVLASGTTEGATGNTKVIMKTPKARHDHLSDAESAVFKATLEVTHPMRVRVSAKGPMNLGDRAMEVSTEMWLIPGKHLNQNDAILLELPGFYIQSELEDKPAAQSQVKVVSEVRMMCGCPIEPDGLWDANHYEITAYLLKNGKELARKPMKFVETSKFEASFKISGAGNYEIVTFAYDPTKANTGVDRILFSL